MKWTCELIEERLIDHIDGALSASELREFTLHSADCARCAALIAGVSGMLAAVQRMEPLPLPAELEAKILDSTLGPNRRRQKRWPGWLGLVQPVFQPRFAMGLATVIFGTFITLQAAGVELGWKDLSPRNVTRQAHLAYARSVKFVNDLRVVYEIQTRLQSNSEREGADSDSKEKKEPDNNERRKRESNQLNVQPCDLCSLAAILPGRSIR